MRVKKITINVQEPYLQYLINGQKRIEGRLNKGKFVAIKKDDILLIGSQAVNFKVVRKTLYNNFNQMIKTEGVKNVIPDKVSIQDAVHVYYKFYTKTEEKKFGVVALEVRKL